MKKRLQTFIAALLLVESQPELPYMPPKAKTQSVTKPTARKKKSNKADSEEKFEGQLSKELMQAVLKKLNRPSPESITAHDFRNINNEIDQRLVLDEQIGRWVYKMDEHSSLEDIFNSDDLEKTLRAPNEKMKGKSPRPGYVYASKVSKKDPIYFWLGYRTLARAFREKRVEARLATRLVKKLLLVYLGIRQADFYQYLNLNQVISRLSGGWEVYANHSRGLIRHSRLWIKEPGGLTAQADARLTNDSSIIDGNVEEIENKLVLRFEGKNRLPHFYAVAPLSQATISPKALEAATVTFDEYSTLSVLIKVRSHHENENEFMSHSIQYYPLKEVAGKLHAGIHRRLVESPGGKANVIEWEDSRYWD